MFRVFTLLTSAVARLAAALDTTAGLVEAANIAARERLGLDEAPALEHHEEAANGRRKAKVS